MDPVATLTRESDRFATILAALAPGTPCPTRPGWTARDLIAHLTEVQSFWAAVLSQDIRTEAEVNALEEYAAAFPGSIDEILPIRAAATRALTAALKQLDDAETRWTWWPPDHTVGFIRRMQLCDTVLHRVDAELAAGLDPAPLGAPVAVTCVNQCIDAIWQQRWEDPGGAVVATAELRAGGHVWIVEIVRGRAGQERGGERAVEARPRRPQPNRAPAATRAARASRVAGANRVAWARRAEPGAAPTVHVAGGLDHLARWAWGRGGEVIITGEPAGVAAVGALVATGAL